MLQPIIYDPMYFIIPITPFVIYLLCYIGRQYAVDSEHDRTIDISFKCNHLALWFVGLHTSFDYVFCKISNMVIEYSLDRWMIGFACIAITVTYILMTIIPLTSALCKD
jgi:hypothetical protein